MEGREAMAKKVLKYKTHEFGTKAEQQDGSVAIEGYANKAIVDSIGDFMIPGGCKLDRYNKNPIMLFGHDRSYPVGKVTKLELRDDGIWVRGEISKSDDPRIRFVRDLVKEGILCTFSIGYEEVLANKRSDGAREITEYVLHEVSIVPLPMNMASTFSVAGGAKAIGKLVAKSGLTKDDAAKLLGVKAEDIPEDEDGGTEGGEPGAGGEGEGTQPDGEGEGEGKGCGGGDGEKPKPKADGEGEGEQPAGGEGTKQAEQPATTTQAVNDDPKPDDNPLLGKMDALIALQTRSVQALEQLGRSMQEMAEHMRGNNATTVTGTDGQQQQAAPGTEEGAQGKALDTGADPVVANLKVTFDTIDSTLKGMGF